MHSPSRPQHGNTKLHRTLMQTFTHIHGTHTHHSQSESRSKSLSESHSSLTSSPTPKKGAHLITQCRAPVKICITKVGKYHSCLARTMRRDVLIKPRGADRAAHILATANRRGHVRDTALPDYISAPAATTKGETMDAITCAAFLPLPAFAR